MECELAEALGMTLADYQKTLQDARGHQLVYFEDFVGEGDEDFLERHLTDDNADPAEILAEQNVKSMLVKAIDQLPERELASGSIDLVLGFDEYMSVPPHLSRETWLTEPLVGVVRADHPGVGNALSLEALITMPHVFHSPLGTRDSIVDQFLAAQGLSRTISVNSQSYMSAAAIVSRSDQLLVLPQRVARMLASGWPLRIVTLPAQMPAYHLNCVWHPLYERQPAQCWLREQMHGLANELRD